MILETEQYVGNLGEVIEEGVKNSPIIYRLTGQGRVYFTRPNFYEDSIIYNSGTTNIDNYRDLQGELAISKWKVDLINSGKDPKIELEFRQNYGTILHILYGNILSGESIQLETLDEYIIKTSAYSKIPKDLTEKVVKRYLGEFKKDILAFSKWITDYNIVPLGVELMLKSDRLRVGTALDLICYATVEEKGDWGEVYKSGPRKDQVKLTKKEVRKLILVDFKSGKKGFYPKNVLQLLESKVIFEENFPDLKIEGIFNFAPNDWVREPSYKFIDQERDSNSNVNYLKSIAENVFARGKAEFEQKILNKGHKVYFGEIKLGKPYENCVKTLNKVQLANYHYDMHKLSHSYFADIYHDNKFKSSKELLTLLDTLTDKVLGKHCTDSKVMFQSREDLFEKLSKINYGNKE